MLPIRGRGSASGQPGPPWLSRPRCCHQGPPDAELWPAVLLPLWRGQRCPLEQGCLIAAAQAALDPTDTALERAQQQQDPKRQHLLNKASSPAGMPNRGTVSTLACGLTKGFSRVGHNGLLLAYQPHSNAWQLQLQPVLLTDFDGHAQGQTHLPQAGVPRQRHWCHCEKDTLMGHEPCAAAALPSPPCRHLKDICISFETKSWTCLEQRKKQQMLKKSMDLYGSVLLSVWRITESQSTLCWEAS